MRIWKFAVLMLTALALLAGCNKKDKDINVVGSWKLDDISSVTKAGQTYGIVVYIDFKSDGTFETWQLMQAGRYLHFTGTWQYVKKGITGVYTDGSAWGSSTYNVDIDGNMMVLTAKNGTDEMTTYVRAEVPADVKANALDK